MDASDLYAWWFISAPIFLVPAMSLLAVWAAIFALILRHNKLDSEDKTAIMTTLIGFVLVMLGLYWKNQLFLDFTEKGEYLEKMDVYYKMALQPMLLQTIGPTLIGLSAFIRTKSHIIPKIIALIYIINVITFNFQWFIAGSPMLSSSATV
jgi:hypothetical protein